HKNPELGRPPTVPASQVFERGAPTTAALWASHPPSYDREQNAKRRYFPSPQDDRPAWLLFRDPPALCEEATRWFYEVGLHLEPPAALQTPDHVQAFIDEEHGAVTFDARYHGIYDNRPLLLDNLEELVRDAPREPAWGPDQ